MHPPSPSNMTAPLPTPPHPRQQPQPHTHTSPHPQPHTHSHQHSPHSHPLPTPLITSNTAHTYNSTRHNHTHPPPTPSTTTTTRTSTRHHHPLPWPHMLQATQATTHTRRFMAALARRSARPTRWFLLGFPALVAGPGLPVAKPPTLRNTTHAFYAPYLALFVSLFALFHLVRGLTWSHRSSGFTLQ